MKVTSVSKYKGSTYEVELDYERKIYLHAEIIADFGVRTDMELDQTELRRVIYASNFRRAYQRALYLLDVRDYSCKEMSDKLIGTYKNERLCAAVIEKLKSIGALNDERYAEKLARKYVEVKRFGYRRAKREMMLRGIGQFLAEDALGQYTETFAENLAELLRGKYARFLTDSSDRKQIERVKSSLVRSGYSFDEINRAVREYFDQQQEEG
jgi:regulatory protein